MKRFSPAQHLLKAALLVIVAAYLSACGSKPNQDVAIPADAQFVFAVNPKAIFEKVGYNEISKLEVFKQMTQELGSGDQGKRMLSLIEEVLKKPEVTGIDPEKQIYMFVTDTQAANKYVGANFILADEAKFTALLKDKLGMDKELKEKDGNKYVQNGDVVIMWNEEAGMMLVADNMDAEKTLLETAASYLKLDNKDGLGGNEDFADFTKNVKDMGMWATVGKASKELPEKQLTDLGLKPEDISNNYFHTYMEFNKGEIVVNSEIKWSKGLRDAFKSMAGDDIGTDLFAYIPGNRMVGFVGFSINMKNLLANVRETAKKSQEMGQGLAMAELGLSASGMSLDKIVESFSGQFFIAVTDLTVEGDPVANKDKSIEQLRTIPQVVVAIGVKSESDMQPLVEKVLQQVNMPVAKEGKLYKVNAGGDVKEVYYTYIEDYLLASNSKKIVEDASKGKLPSNQQVAGDVAKLAKGPVVAYVDFTSKALPENLKKEYTFALLINEIGLRSASLENTGDYVRMSARLANNSVNSLVSLLKLADLPHKMAMHERSQRMEAMEMDEAEETVRGDSY